MCVSTVRVSPIIINSPDGIQKLFSGKDDVFVLSELCKQIKFLGRKFYREFVQYDHSGVQLNGHVSEAENMFRLLFAGAP